MKSSIIISLTIASLCGGLILQAQNQTGAQSSDRLIRVIKNQKVGFINKTGKLVVPCQFDFAYDFSDGLAGVVKNGKLGFIDKTGKTVIPYTYRFDSEAYGTFSDGLACAIKDRNHLVLDKSGKMVSNLGSDVVVFDSFREGLVLVGVYDMGDYAKGFVSKTGEKVVPFIYDDANSFSEGLAYVIKDGKAGYIDREGKTVIPFIYDSGGSFSEGLAVVEKNGVYCIIDKSGKKVADFNKDVKYMDNPVFRDGLVAIRIKDYYGPMGFADISGKIVIPCIYDEVKCFSEGLACVQRNGQYGYVDRTGKTIIPCVYGYAENFCDGVAVVQKEGVFGLLDKTGAFIPISQYDSIGEAIAEEMVEEL